MRPYLLYSLLFCLLFTVSCKVKEKPVNKEEALAMAKNIDSAVTHSAGEYYWELFNMDVFFERMAASSGFEASFAVKRSAKAEMKASGFGTQFIKQLALSEGNRYELAKHYEKNQVHHLLFRLYGEAGFNYHDYELTKVGDKVFIA